MKKTWANYFSYLTAFANRNDMSAMSKAWNEQSRTSGNATVSANAAAGNRSQPNTATAAGNGNSNKNATSNANTSAKQVPSPTGAASTSGIIANAKIKGKKEDPTNKKSSTALTQTVLKNDELSKWGVKALSGLKPSVDGELLSNFVQS